MTLQPAPFYSDIAQGPEGGAAYWVTTQDDIRIRVAHWGTGSGAQSGEKAGKGTVFLFPGRTEYIEKYGRAAADLAARGYDTLVVDWRGQGLADRLIADVRLGHIDRFANYQRDVEAMIALAHDIGAPGPFYLLAHSMGGAIGLRSVMERADFKAVAFSAPMWGIRLAPHLRVAAHAGSWLSKTAGFDHKIAPGTKYQTYVLAEKFEGNTLTRDHDMFEYMQAQAHAQSDLVLGGPTLGWLYESLMETAFLARRPSPDLPCITFLGSNERIVDTARIHDRMARWDMGTLDVMEGAEHEVLMERPFRRSHAFDRLDALFQSA